jgi:TonB family protein
VVLLAGSAAAGGFWFNSRLDRQYAALNREYEAAAYASSYALAQAAQADIIEVVTPDDSVTVSETEEAQPTPEEPPRNKAEQDLLDRKTAERQKALAAARLAEQQVPSFVAMKPETRKTSPLPPLTSQVSVIGDQTIADNRAAAVLMNAGAALGPPEPPPPAPAPARRQVVTAEAISKAQPSYPRSAVTAHVSGSVAVLVTISEQGNVTEARAVSGPSLLWGAAVDAARRWKFKPSTIGGVPAKTSKTIVFNFKYDKYEK